MAVQSERDLRLSLPTVFSAGLRRNTLQTTYREERQSGKYVHLPQDELLRAASIIVLPFKHGTFMRPVSG